MPQTQKRPLKRQSMRKCNSMAPTPQQATNKTNKMLGLKMRRALHDSFAHAQEPYALDTIRDILDGVIAHGVDMADWAGTANKSRKELEREIQLYRLQHFIRGYRDAKGQRIIRYGNGRWYHLTGKAYLQTRSPETPDADIRRQEGVALREGVAKRLHRLFLGVKRNYKGETAVVKQLKDGAVFEQPALPTMDEEAV